MRFPVLVLAVATCLIAPSAPAFVWPNTAERIEKQLKSDDVALRRRAARRLGELPRAVAERLAPGAIDDPDIEVRLSAVDAALSLRLPNVGKRVITWLNDPERRVRLAAAETLRDSPSPEAINPLGRVLADPDAGVRVAAAEALGASGSSDAVMRLLGHLDDTAPEVRQAVVRALARLGDKRAVVPLIGKIQDSRPVVRQSVADALGELGDLRASSALLLALRDNDDTVRVAALEALAMLKARDATLAMLSLAKNDPVDSVRVAALQSLAKVGSADGLDALIGALDDLPPGFARHHVWEALAEFGEPAIKRLSDCLVGQPPAAQAEGCVHALGKIDSKKSAAPIVAALRRGVVTPIDALSALAELGRPEGLPAALEHVSDADPFVRRAAISACAALLDPHKPDGRAVEPLVRALRSPRAGKAERSALAALLGRTGSPRGVAALAPLAETADDVALRVAACEALGLIPPSGQDQALLTALGAEEASVRLAAAIALSRSASGAAARTLLDRLSESAEQDRGALSIALAGALSRSKDAAILARAERLMLRSHDADRDALIEAIGRAPGALGSAPLLRLLGGAPSIADRVKVAEALAQHPEALTTLRHMAADVDGAVRANAVWSLGQVGKGPELATLVATLKDRDVAVAGNAVAAIGRFVVRGISADTKPLCSALADSRSYVRANALAALRLAKRRCGGKEARQLLEQDRAEVVREAAAELILGVPSKQAEQDRAVLRRCASEDPSGRVARACSEKLDPLEPGAEPVSVYVVPIGESTPTPRAPFALVLADGVMRLGVTDRRGEVFEVKAPRGELSLAVPAPLAR